MFSTSTDVLNLVLAFSIFILTGFLCASLYYLISSLKKAHKVIKTVETIASKTEDVINLTKEKIKNSGTYFMLFGDLLRKLMDYFVSKQTKTENSKEKTKSKRK